MDVFAEGVRIERFLDVMGTTSLNETNVRGNLGVNGSLNVGNQFYSPFLRYDYDFGYTRQNTGLGALSLQQTESIGNTATGYESLRNLSTGRFILPLELNLS